MTTHAKPTLPGLILLAIVMTIVAPSAYADSDGNYCVEPGYLAVTFRSFMTPGLQGNHVLKIVRFDEKLGPRWAGEAILDDFQTHAMACQGNVIKIEGAGNRGRGLVSYVLNLDGDGIPRITADSSDPHYVFVPHEGPPQIGHSASPGVTVLPSADSRHRFQLRNTQTPARKTEQGLITEKKTVLEEIDESGVVTRSLVLWQGQLIETAD